MPKGENHNKEKKYDYWAEMARNIMWAQGNALLTSDQTVELYGNGVEVDIISGDEDSVKMRRMNPLPIAGLTFSNKTAHVLINETDYKNFLDDICRPANIDGHKAMSYYLGLGIAYNTLNEMLENAVYKREESEHSNFRRKFLELATKPIGKEDVDFIITNIVDTDPDVKERSIKIFENIMRSDDVRMGRINMLRYAVAAHSFAFEQADKNWAIWCSDDKDRARYSIDFINACTDELILQIKSWIDRIKMAEVFHKEFNYSKLVDGVEELYIAGSMPMAPREMNEILNLIND
jgi:hypothetical protein